MTVSLCYRLLSAMASSGKENATADRPRSNSLHLSRRTVASHIVATNKIQRQSFNLAKPLVKSQSIAAHGGKSNAHYNNWPVA